MNPENGMKLIFESMKQAGKEEAKKQIARANPELSGMFDLDPNDEKEDESDFEDSEEDFDDEEVYSMVFETEDAATNLSLAAAAWRIASEYEDDFVAQHEKTGIAFFGSEDDFEEYCDQRDLNKDWKHYKTAAEIKALDCDVEAFKEVLDGLESEEDDSLEAARKCYEDFHWGDKAQVTGFVSIPGVEPSAKLTFLGVARQICYGAKKDGKFEEYYHNFGEESGTFPALYSVDDKTLVVFGGKMSVTPRGIVD